MAISGEILYILMVFASTRHALAGEEARVSLKLFYESDCPGCMFFLEQQLGPLYSEDWEGSIDLQLFPYGNANETYDRRSKTWVFQCQHGSGECRGNLIEACVLQAAKFRPADYMSTVLCMEQIDGRGDAADNGERCVEESGRFKWTEIDGCARGRLGNALLHKVARWR